MPLTDAARETALTALGTAITHVSLHTGDPGTTGAAEVTGGDYARVAVTWDPTGGNLTITAPAEFDVAGGTTVSHYGLWAGATFYGGDTLSASETFANAGTYTLTDLDINLN